MFGFLWEMRGYFRQVAGQLVLGSLAGILMNTAVVLPALALGGAIDRALAWQGGRATPEDVAWAAAAFVGATLLTEVPRIGKRWWLITANSRIRANVRADAFRGVLAWPMAIVQVTPLGDLMARIVGDVEVLGVGVREFTIETWDTLLFSLSFVVAMLVVDARLTVLALLPVPGAMLLAHAAGRWVARRTTRAREANGALTAAIQEQLAGVRLLRLFGRSGSSVALIDGLSRTFAARNLDAIRLKGGLQPVYSTLMTSGVLLIVWQGSERVVAGAMTIGAFVAYVELFLRFVNRGHRIPQLANSLQSGAAAYARLRPLLAPPLCVQGEPPRASFDPGHVAGLTQPMVRPPYPHLGAATVALQGVTFRYPGAPTAALRDISLRVPAGALVGVTGPVGSGKSALMRAILGIYPLESGWVLVNGHPVKDLSAADRAGLIGYLPQEPLLFSGSIRENIQLSVTDGGGERVLQRALDIACLADDLARLPDGLDTLIGEAGVRVSGGQRQRIGLARALAAAAHLPAVLVLDDPFSSVDVATEARIVAGLRVAFGPGAPPEDRMTIILCSHRLAVFPHADFVVMLSDGGICEQGAHADLLRSDGLYARIYRAQSVTEAGERQEVPAW